MVDSSSQHFPEFLNAIPDAVVAIDGSGVIRFVNLQLEHLFGYNRDELLGKEIETLIPERFHEQHVHHRALYMLDPVKRPMGTGLALAGRKKDGLEFPVDIQLSTVFIDEKQLYMAAIRDITDRKRYEAMFVQDLGSAVNALTEGVSALKQQIKDESDARTAEREWRTKQRRRDWAIVFLIVGACVAGYLVQRHNDQTQAGNCQATNQAVDVIHDIFEPFLVPNPDPTFEAMTPEEKALVAQRNAKASQGLQSFKNELERRTAPRDC